MNKEDFLIHSILKHLIKNIILYSNGSPAVYNEYRMSTADDLRQASLEARQKLRQLPLKAIGTRWIGELPKSAFRWG